MKQFKMEEQLNNQVGNTLKTNITEELTSRTPVPGTPFTLVSNEGKHFIAFGAYRLTAIVDNQHELLEMIDEKDWKLLINLQWAVCMDYWAAQHQTEPQNPYKEQTIGLNTTLNEE